ncbi:MAG: synthase protein [Streptomyces sp.]|jgi:ATP synthase protein I|nr:synthase protein [Streptomyces sp.]
MQSNDVRTILNCAVPTAAAGVIAVAASAALAGGKGVIGAVFGAVLVIAFMATGFIVLQRTARSLPHLFQAMGLMLYTTQLLLLALVMLAFKNTTLFSTKAFAFTLLATTIVWIAAQARSYLKAKVLYVEPDSAGSPS